MKDYASGSGAQLSVICHILVSVTALLEYIKMREMYSLIFIAVTQRHYPVSSKQPLIMQNQTRQWN